MTFDIHQEIVGVLPHLRAFARSLTGDADKADDLVQDTVVRALNAAAQFTPGTNFKAWTFTILRNLHVNHLRRRKIQADQRGGVDLDLIPVPATQPSSLEFEDMRRALACLSPEQHEVVLLIGASGFSYEDAARICGCAVGTIKSRLCRARRELARLMGLDEEDAREEQGNRKTLPPRVAQTARTSRKSEAWRPAIGQRKAHAELRAAL